MGYDGQDVLFSLCVVNTKTKVQFENPQLQRGVIKGKHFEAKCERNIS